MYPNKCSCSRSCSSFGALCLIIIFEPSRYYHRNGSTDDCTPHANNIMYVYGIGGSTAHWMWMWTGTLPPTTKLRNGPAELICMHSWMVPFPHRFLHERRQCMLSVSLHFDIYHNTDHWEFMNNNSHFDALSNHHIASASPLSAPIKRICGTFTIN